MLHAFVLLMQVSPCEVPWHMFCTTYDSALPVSREIYSINRREGQVLLHTAPSTVRSPAASAPLGSGALPGNPITASDLHDSALKRARPAPRSATPVPGVCPGDAEPVGYASPDQLWWPP